MAAGKVYDDFKAWFVYEVVQPFESGLILFFVQLFFLKMLFSALENIDM